MQSLSAHDALAIMNATECAFEENLPECKNESNLACVHHWKPYEKPNNSMCLRDCLETDASNVNAWKLNRGLSDAAFVLLKRLDVPAHQSLRKPPMSYTRSLKDSVESKARECKSFMTIMAFDYLYAELQLTPYKDYDPAHAIHFANNYAAQKYVDENRLNGEIKLPKIHERECGCNNNIWDGFSDKCEGGIFNVHWRTLNQHVFYNPQVEVDITLCVSLSNNFC